MLEINGFKVVPTIFPDKTSQVWKLPNELFKSVRDLKAINIFWKFEAEHELIWLCQAILLVEQTVGYEYSINLNIPYMPYARQDKEISNESCFALKNFIEFLTRIIGPDSVTTFDVHNAWPLENTNFKFTNILPEKEIRDIVRQHKVETVVFPDDGAAQRYKNLLRSDISIACGKKVRNQLTGEITGLDLFVEASDYCPFDGVSVLVVDDICDGGRTFVELAKKITPSNPRELILYVSHGIFSKGLDVLKDAGYTSVYTREGRVTL